MNITFTIQPEILAVSGYLVVAFITAVLLAKYSFLKAEPGEDLEPYLRALGSLLWPIIIPFWLLMVVFGIIPAKLLRSKGR